MLHDIDLTPLEVGDLVYSHDKGSLILQAYDDGWRFVNLQSNETASPLPVTQEWINEHKLTRIEASEVVAIYDVDQDPEFYWTIGVQDLPFGPGFSRDELRTHQRIEQRRLSIDQRDGIEWRLYDKQLNLSRRVRQF